MVDYYSRYYEYDILKLTTSDKIIDSLKSIFIRYDLPVRYRSDQGPQFKSEQFSMFCESNGIKHLRTTPKWAQANGVSVMPKLFISEKNSNCTGRGT